MYETPSRSNSSNRRRPPALAAPSLSTLGPMGSSHPASGSMYAGASTPNLLAPPNGFQRPRSMMSPGSPPPPMAAPQTPQQRLMLRKPMSMQTLSSMRSNPRLNSTPRTGTGAGAIGSGSAEVYKGKIHVGVRAKPNTTADGMSSAVGGSWLVNAESNLIEHDSAGNFCFDKVYDGTASNAEVFDQSVESLVQQVVDGYNATVFAYGTTGSGKTFTMQGSEFDPGVIQRSVHRLFDLIAESGRPGLVRLSYFEIYNERVYDLLTGDSKPTEVMLRDGSMGYTRVVGQREVETRNAEELLRWVAAGDQLRRTSSTQYNEHSSRSHAVVRIQVTSNNSQSIMYLCDLAGSERAVVHTERRREGSYINKSLLTLSTVISILSQGGGGHVPYRDSKLTRLLQPSLSGTALVSMLCTIQTGPPPAGGAETVNSVRFAAKAKNITVMAKRNSVFDDTLTGSSAGSSRMVEQVQLENETLRREISKLKAERDDLQEKLLILESSGEANPEASLEAMSGISFDDDDDETDADTTREGGNGNGHGHGQLHHLTAKKSETKLLRKELAYYKEENDKLHSRVSHLVSEITALDANIANLESLSGSDSAPSSTTGEDVAALHREIAELKEQLKDRDLVIECLSGINDARAKLLDPPQTAASTPTAEAIQDLRI